ncbi:hypothetical protein AB0M42_12110, partial [Streptomyces sp. NPDC051784]|uniref:hypothetical protein n=1 Tax=Streptomyces sp. NPDC051784 TaxID=3155805 RepID=UPI00342DE796
GAAGLALVIGISFLLFGPVTAVGSAFGAFQERYQRSGRPPSTRETGSGSVPSERRLLTGDLRPATYRPGDLPA